MILFNISTRNGPSINSGLWRTPLTAKEMRMKIIFLNCMKKKNKKKNLFHISNTMHQLFR